MGKSVPRGIKTRAEDLMKLYKEKFTTDYEKNREIVNSLDLPFPKSWKNTMVGYITRKVKEKQSA